MRAYSIITDDRVKLLQYLDTLGCLWNGGEPFKPVGLHSSQTLLLLNNKRALRGPLCEHKGWCENTNVIYDGIVKINFHGIAEYLPHENFEKWFKE